MDNRSLVRVWYKAEFLRRTIRLRDGSGTVMDAAPPEHRVAWSEIVIKAREAGMTEEVVDLRLWWGNWTHWLTKTERLDDASLKLELSKLEFRSKAKH